MINSHTDDPAAETTPQAEKNYQLDRLTCVTDRIAVHYSNPSPPY